MSSRASGVVVAGLSVAAITALIFPLREISEASSNGVSTCSRCCSSPPCGGCGWASSPPAIFAATYGGVPMQLALDSPLPRQCTAGLPLLETIEQRAAAAGVPVDSRVDRGRTLRHAVREAIAHERYDRLVVAAGGGLGTGDIAWLLDHAPGEVVIIRAADDETHGRDGHRPQPLAG